MRCSICGAKLSKPGDICTECYKLYQEEEELKKDTNVRLKLKRKYTVTDELGKYWEIILVFAISAFGCVAFNNFLGCLATVGLLIVILGLLMFIDKRLALGSKATFYDTKAVYKFKAFGFKKEKVVKYSDIVDVNYFQTMRQKRKGYGDLCVYTKGAIPLLNGFQLKNVENVELAIQAIAQILTGEEE